MIWVNVDKPTKRCVIHSKANCIFVKKKKTTTYKGVGILKRDGGWMVFSRQLSAENYCRFNFTDFFVSRCC